LPLSLIETTLAGLARHDVVPVVLRPGGEPAADRTFGIARLRDAETGSTRTILLRPALRRSWAAAAAERSAALARLFRSHRLRPLQLGDPFRAETVAAYFGIA
jgi:hypothetical protein